MNCNFTFVPFLSSVDGNWSDWGSWGQCLVRPCMNETGVQTRTRTCTNPQPQFLGQKCEGTTMDSKPCVNNDNCPGILSLLPVYANSNSKNKKVIFGIRFNIIRSCPLTSHRKITPIFTIVQTAL